MKKLLNDPRAVERTWSGTFPSALEMPGCSLSVLRVDDAMLGLPGAQTSAPPWGGSGRVPVRRTVRTAAASLEQVEQNRSSDSCGPAVLAAARAAGTALEAAAGRLTALDSATGDGELGISMRRGAKPGDRTMLDARLPVVGALKAGLVRAASPAKAWAACAAAAEAGSAATAEMTPRPGRASCLGARAIGHHDGALSLSRSGCRP